MKDSLTGGLEKLQAKLATPFPEHLVQTKRKGGMEISFVPYTYYVSRLNEVLPFGWSCDITNVKTVHSQDGGKLLLTVAVTLKGRTFTGTGVADASKEKDNWGGAHSEAFSQAFRRACAQFGMGLYMYHDGEVSVDTFPEKEVPDGSDGLGHDGPDDSGNPEHDTGDHSGGDDAGAGVEGHDPPAEEEPEAPTEAQQERLRGLFATGVFDEAEIDTWREKLRTTFTKKTAGVVIRQMKERYEDETGKPYEAS